MAPWRARVRRVVLRRTAPSLVGQYPLEIGLTVWGGYAAFNVASGDAQSNALSVLPTGLEILWAVLMSIAAITVVSGLIINRYATIASGMYLFSCTLAAFCFAVLSASGWSRGGAIAGFLGIMGIVCLLRGWWLKEQESALMKEIARTKAKDD